MLRPLLTKSCEVRAHKHKSNLWSETRETEATRLAEKPVTRKTTTCNKLSCSSIAFLFIYCTPSQYSNHGWQGNMYPLVMGSLSTRVSDRCKRHVWASVTHKSLSPACHSFHWAPRITLHLTVFHLGFEDKWEDFSSSSELSVKTGLSVWKAEGFTRRAIPSASPLPRGPAVFFLHLPPASLPRRLARSLLPLLFRGVLLI